MFLERIILRFPAIKRQLAVHTTDIVFTAGGWCEIPACFYHLVRFACPSSFVLVWPAYIKRGFAGISDALVRWILHGCRYILVLRF